MIKLSTLCMMTVIISVAFAGCITPDASTPDATPTPTPDATPTPEPTPDATPTPTPTNNTTESMSAADMQAAGLYGGGGGGGNSNPQTPNNPIPETGTAAAVVCGVLFFSLIFMYQKR